MNIKILDAVESEISRDDGMRIRSCLAYPIKWRQPTGIINPYTKKPVMKMKEGTSYAFTLNTGPTKRFHTGLVTRVEQYCKKQGIPVEVDDQMIQLACQHAYKVGHTITLREDQYQLAKKAASRQRGIIKAPTGQGKTIMMLGLIQWFCDSPVLVLAHTNTIVRQTAAKFEEEGLEVAVLGGGSTDTLEDLEAQSGPPLMVSTVQSFVKLDPTLYRDVFEMVICDECHRVSSTTGQFATVLGNLLAPIRLGFTATPPVKPEAILACEGLLGPIIGEMTMTEATELGILAKPKVHLLKTNYSSYVHALQTYPEVYQAGIVENKERNNQIIERAEFHVDKGETVLIFVTKIEHGEILMEYAGVSATLRCCTKFVRGETKAESREALRSAFNKKDIKCVVATAVWKEGVDLPELNCLINGAGGKSEIQTLQSIGRGLRKTDDKEEVIIYDFFDPSHRHLVGHFGYRISTYFEQGWMGE